MAINTTTLNQIDQMTPKQLQQHIDARRAQADSLITDASNFEREAALARREAGDCISEVAYARMKLRRLGETTTNEL